MRLIDGDALLEKMKRRREYVGRPSDPVCLVEDAPTIDAVPVVHGRWIKLAEASEWDQKRCSVCGDVACCQGNYCMNCGAKMDGGDNDA